MKNSSVLIITGETMEEISNQFFQIAVSPGCDHAFLLEQFMVDYQIKYPYWDYCFSHDAMKLAVMGNIVVLIGSCYHLLVLPDLISDYQREILLSIQDSFYNNQSFFSIMNIQRKREKLVYEEIDSSLASEMYFELIERKYKKWKSKGKGKKLIY